MIFDTIISVLISTVSVTTPILLAATGGMYTQTVDELNIGLEGLMLISSFFSIYIFSISGSVLTGIITGIAISVLMSLSMILFRIKLKANIFILGLATNLLAAGLVSFFGVKLLGSKGTVIFGDLSKTTFLLYPLRNQLDFADSFFGNISIFDFMAFAAVGISQYIIFHTSTGIRMRAVGLSKKTAVSVGINPDKNKIMAYMFCGIFCGISGAALSIPVNSFAAGMTNGRGWIALVAVILGRNNPIGIMFAALIFGFSSSLSNILQAGTEISPKILMIIPFMVTLFALIFSSISKNKGKGA